jgi:hypothetical protein
VSLQAGARRGDGSVLRLLVTNLSYEGCTVLGERSLEIGEVVNVTVPGLGAMDAQVRWVCEDKAGLSFLLGKSVQEDRRARLGF